MTETVEIVEGPAVTVELVGLVDLTVEGGGGEVDLSPYALAVSNDVGAGEFLGDPPLEAVVITRGAHDPAEPAISIVDSVIDGILGINGTNPRYRGYMTADAAGTSYSEVALVTNDEGDVGAVVEVEAIDGSSFAFGHFLTSVISGDMESEVVVASNVTRASLVIDETADGSAYLSQLRLRRSSAVPAGGPQTDGVAFYVLNAAGADTETVRVVFEDGTTRTIAARSAELFQPLAAVLTATTASFTTADETKLDGIEALADVTDATNVDAAGALMKVAGGDSVENIGAVESNVQTVASTGATETLDLSVYGVFDMTMDQACEFTFSNPAPSGKATIFTLILRGAFTPTFPATVDWGDASAPTYATPSQYVFTTVDAGTTYLGQLVAGAFG
jgi:hypothetical protein